MAGGRPPLYASVDELSGIIDTYFAGCIEDNKPMTISGLALALGMTTETLRMYAEKDEFSAPIKNAKQKVEADVECRLLSGAAPAGSIFWLKNNAGWKDKTEQDLRATVQVEEITRTIVKNK